MERNRICLNNITQGGVACKNPTITWTNAGDTCLLINCVDDNCVTVQVPDDCDERCVTFILDCEDCDQCPPVVITRCLCDDNGDCPNCEDCVTGFCTPVECPDQVCDPDTGDCVDCFENGQCPCDQECVNNQCQCPDPSQFVNDKGCCVDCLTNDHCPECHNCVGGTCVPIVCPDGLCDPDTNSCVECLTGTDCTGDNECCIGNRCACCPGFFRNAEGDCVEIPQCNSDDDCPACFVCVDGECAPQVCPEGKVCVDGECVDECDCYNPQCSGGRQCVPHYSGTCYCRGCEGPCSNNVDCGEGCVCINGQCTKAPCYGPCRNGGDCGPGCGCVNGVCQPCNTFTCDQCAIVNGCDCIGGACVDSPCDKPCVDGRDCDTGCGCRSNNCVSCESVSCTQNSNCPEGCFCDNGVCRSNPCAEVFCSSPNDCGEGCGCFEGRCYPCSSRSCANQECDTTPGCKCVNGTCVDDGDGCTDELTLEKNDSDCTLVGRLETNACCQCDDIEARFLVTYNTSSTASYKFDMNLYKGGVLIDASPNISEDLPISGNLLLEFTQIFREVNSQGNFIPNGGSISRVMTRTQPVSTSTALTTYTFQDGYQGIPIPLPNSTVVINGKNYRVAQRSLGVKTGNTVNIINECSYSLPEVFVYGRGNYQQSPPSDGATYSFIRRLTKLVFCRRPLFELYEATSVAGLSNAGNVIKRGYASRVGSGYQVTYTVSDGIEYGKYYRLYTGCGCKNSAVYSCFGSNTATPLVFCNPTGILDYTISNCGKTLEFDSNVTVTCPVYLNGSSKPVYQLYINGDLVATRTLGTAPANGTTIFFTGDSFTVPSCITSVDLKLSADVCELCTISQQNACQDLVVEILGIVNDCSNPNAGVLNFRITGGVPDYDWSVVQTGDSGTVSAPGTYSVPIDLSTFNSNQITLIVTDDSGGGCQVTRSRAFTKVQSNINFTATGSCVNNLPRLTISGNYPQSAVNIVATSGANYLSTTVGPGAFNTILNLQAGGTWTITAASVLYPNCVATRVVSVDCCSPAIFAGTSLSYNCSTGLIISGAPSGAVFRYGNQIVNSGFTFQTNGTYTIVGAVGTCTQTFNITVNCQAAPCSPSSICSLFPIDAIITHFIVNGNTYTLPSNGIPPVTNGIANTNFIGTVTNLLTLAGVVPCGTPQSQWVFVFPSIGSAGNMSVISGATTIQMFYTSQLSGPGSFTLQASNCLG